MCLVLLYFAVIKFLALPVTKVSFKMLWQSDGFIESLANYSSVVGNFSHFQPQGFWESVFASVYYSITTRSETTQKIYSKQLISSGVSA